MDNKKEYCQNLYKKYRELREKTKLEAQEVGPDGRYNSQYINLQEFEEMLKTRDELENCLNYLDEEFLRDLFEDSYFMDKALRILIERNKNNQNLA